MNNDFERHIVEKCAPTLAGIKPGNLFYYKAKEGENIDGIAFDWNRRLEKKGIRVILVRKEISSGLVYVYRPSILSSLFSNAEVRSFLDGFGFSGCRLVEDYIGRLILRFNDKSGFPHEIGIFLGYPLNDVKGFIDNKGKGFSICGLWKVYDDKMLAESLFEQYRRCSSVYTALYNSGKDILNLGVLP